MCRLAWLYTGGKTLQDSPLACKELSIKKMSSADNESNESFTAIHCPGYAVLIVNIGNDDDQEKFQIRKGAREDSGNLQTVFVENFGLKWLNSTRFWHENLPISRWDHRKAGIERKPNPEDCCLRCNIKSLDHSRSDCFVLAISSHGHEVTETEILFIDGQYLRLSEIFEALSDENCPSLKGKPRIIILQACRSNFADTDKVESMQDHGHVLMVSDGTAENEERPEGAEGNSHDLEEHDNGRKASAEPLVKERFTIEAKEDLSFQLVALNKLPEQFLLVYPCVSGQRSYRNTPYGSWFLDGLKEVLLDKYVRLDCLQKPINFLHLLTDVSRHVAIKRETTVFERIEGSDKIKKDESGNRVVDAFKSGVKNAVCCHHRLTRPLIFYPKVKDLESNKDLPEPFDVTGQKKKNKSQLALLRSPEMKLECHYVQILHPGLNGFKLDAL